MEEYLIKNTTREQREQIVKDSLGYSELGCDDAMDGYDMYLPYIEGIKELREITMEYQAQYVRDMEPVRTYLNCGDVLTGSFFQNL